MRLDLRLGPQTLVPAGAKVWLQLGEEPRDGRDQIIASGIPLQVRVRLWRTTLVFLTSSSSQTAAVSPSIVPPRPVWGIAVCSSRYVVTEVTPYREHGRGHATPYHWRPLTDIHAAARQR